MPLTHQAFAQIPAIQELSRELYVNVSENERLFSGVAGAALLLSLGHAKGLGKLAQLAMAAGLLTRALSGHCALYKHFNMDTHHKQDPIRPTQTSTPSQETIQPADAPAAV